MGVFQEKKKLMKLNSHFEYECVVVFQVKRITALKVSIGMCFPQYREKNKQAVIASGSFLQGNFVC